MSDYKRFVGYFYEYIDGKRQRNAGFIKAEERNGIWRVGLQLRAARWPEKRLEILGYGAEGDGYDTVLLGMGCPQGDIFWQKLQFHEDTVNLKGKSFEQLAGMWIPCGHGRDFLSHWANDEPKVEKLWTLGERRDVYKRQQRDYIGSRYHCVAEWKGNGKAKRQRRCKTDVECSAGKGAFCVYRSDADREGLLRNR